MLLGKLLKSVSKNYRKIPVGGISFDSRKVKKRDIFFAIKGNQTSGIKFINDALSKGASAVISSEKVKYKNRQIPLILVKNVRKSLSEACSNFYKKKPPNIVAVTGTNGKSSVADFFYQILRLNKIPVASIGTLGVFSKNYNKKTNLTSMDSLSLHKNLQILARNKVNYVILEASSHGLQQKRLNNLNINTGIFTNLSHDHLDYHKSMKSYFDSKMYLFKNLLKKNSKIITDEENKEFKIIKNIANKRKIKKITIGSTSGNIIILHTKYKKSKQIVKISINSKIFLLDVPLIGYFQVKNLLMAALAASCCGLNQNKIFNQIHKIRPVPGRLECVASLNNNSNIIVDFAHTPDALEQSLIALKKQFKKEIILVFGCGGERIINVPKRSIGDSTVKQLHDWGRKNKKSLEDSAVELLQLNKIKPKTKIGLMKILNMFNKWRSDLKKKKHFELMEIVLDESGYSKMLKDKKDLESEGRLENLKELIRGMRDFDSLQGFLEHVALATSIDQDWDGQKVNLMTIHASKGLEFDAVFLPGWEEGLFPHQKSLEEKGDLALEEERRLAYVGLTRAKKESFISFVMSRMYRGDWVDSLASRFIDELPEKNIEKKEVKEQSNEDFFFNQDIDYSEGIRSPGWARLQKGKLKRIK